MTPCVWLVAWLAVLLSAQGLRAADSSYCATCGMLIAGEFYLVKDAVTLEQRSVCKACQGAYPACFLCGLPARTNLVECLKLADGRVLCARDAAGVVLEEAKVLRIARETKDLLDRLFSRFMTFPETNVALAVVDRVHLHELFKFAGADRPCPNVWGFLQTRKKGDRYTHQMSLLGGVPESSLRATTAHEYAHAWIKENLPAERRKTLGPDAEEGFCELIAYLLMNSIHDEAQKAVILRNTYTRGQVELFVDAEGRYGLNDVLDWMKFGIDDKLAGDEPGRIRRATIPRGKPPVATPAYAPPAKASPEALALKAVFWNEQRPLAMINGRTLGLREEGKVPLGGTNVIVRVLAIDKQSVRVRLPATGEEKELRLKEP